MAEFCLECWNKINENEDSGKEYIISKDLDLCEHCGEWKPVIVMTRKAYYMHKFRYFILPFKLVYKLLRILYFVFEDIKSKNNHS